MLRPVGTVTGTDHSLPPATSRRELRERERAAESMPPVAQQHTAFIQPGATFVQPSFLQQAEQRTSSVDATFAAAFEGGVDAAEPVEAEGASARARRRPRMRRSSAPRAARAPRAATPHRTVRRGFGSRLLSGTAMIFAGGLLVGTTLPANALDVFTVSDTADTSMLAAAVEMKGQSIEISGDVGEVIAARDTFEVKSWSQVLRDQYGTRGSYTYNVGGTGAVRWPFPYFVPISSGYGERAAPCRGCSTTHNAIDLTPGAGAPIYSIADGVVIRREPRGGSWGNNLTIEHTINGQTVTSSYAHMQWDSSPIELGDQVKVGDFLGLVGATGQATGAHLHLEIKVNGTYVDPYVWLKANAG